MTGRRPGDLPAGGRGTWHQATDAAAWSRYRTIEANSPALAAAVRVLYGGSVKASNVAAIMAQPDVDGALVGGASIDAAEFASIVRYRDHAATSVA